MLQATIILPHLFSYKFRFNTTMNDYNDLSIEEIQTQSQGSEKILNEKLSLSYLKNKTA